MSKQSKSSSISTEQTERNLLVWALVSAVSWMVYTINGGTLFGLWADLTIIAVAVWIFRYVWQKRKPAKGWNGTSVTAGLIAVSLCLLWLVVLGVMYALLPKSSYFSS